MHILVSIFYHVKDANVPVHEGDGRIGGECDLVGLLAGGEVVDDADATAGRDAVHEGDAEATVDTNDAIASR